MSDQKGFSGSSAWRLAAIIMGLRLLKRDTGTRQEDLKQALAEIAQDRDLQARDVATAVQKAAVLRTYLRLGLIGSAVVALVLAALAALILYVGPPVRRAVANRLNPPTLTPTPTLEPRPTATHTPVPVPWTFNGHVYRNGTAEGIEGASIRLQSFSNNDWTEVEAIGSAGDGSFTLTYQGPQPLEGGSIFRLVLELPPNWNVVTHVQAPNWIWSEADSRIVEARFSRPEEVQGVTFHCAIRRTFSGAVYFEGENTPASATVQLRHWDPATEAWSDPVDSMEVTKPPESPRQVIPAPFKLSHVSTLQGVDYQISIAPTAEGQTLDWAAGIPADKGQVEGSAVRISGQQGLLDVDGITFAGPLPIRLGHQLADFSPSYDSANPGPWRDPPDLEPIVDFPYATRDTTSDETQNTPRGMLARWPLWLPPGNSYEVWVGQPDKKNSAIAMYELTVRHNMEEGQRIESTSFSEIAQCQNEGQTEKLAGTYPSDRIEPGGAFWLKIDESKARRNEECKADAETVWFFRLPVWYVEVRRGG